MRAVVDIGSNSTKFLLAEPQRAAEGPFETKSVVTRLGRGIQANKHFAPQSLADTVQTLESFSQHFKSRGCKDVIVVGTSAVRDASDRDSLGLEVKRIFGVPLRVLSGVEEAEYSMRGAGLAASTVYNHDPCVFCEVGGASTQVGMVDPKLMAHSFQAGAVRCHEGLGLDMIPVSDKTWIQAKKNISTFFPDSEWIKLFSQWSKLDNARAVVIGGSLVLAARVSGAKAIGDKGFLCTRAQMNLFNEKLRKLSLNERLALPFMEAGRADILCAGLLCLDHVLNRIHKAEFFVTSWGLRHGLMSQP